MSNKEIGRVASLFAYATVPSKVTTRKKFDGLQNKCERNENLSLEMEHRMSRITSASTPIPIGVE